MGLTSFLEAEPQQAPYVIPKLYSFMKVMNSMLADNYLGYVGRNDSAFDYHWGITRSQDMILSLQWLYEKSPPPFSFVPLPLTLNSYPEGNEDLLLQNMKYFNDAAWDWAYFYSPEIFPFADMSINPPPDDDLLFWYYHGVNSAMGLKAPAVVRRFTHNESLVDVAQRGYNWTFEYHGQISGTIIGDEPWAGLSPTRGSELCTTVEAMFSLGYNYRALGNSYFADRAELAAFNALPTAVSPDWWSHQYMTQTNQPYSVNLTGNPFWNVNTVGQTFGLEPYPKFVASSYVKVGSTGIGHAALIPSTLTTTLEGAAVSINCITSYPFSDTLTYIIDSTIDFTFYVRVPEWANMSTSSTQVTGEDKQPLTPDSTTAMHGISISSGTNTLVYTIGTDIRIVPRARDTVAIYHGQLLYAIPINGSSTSTPPHQYNTQQLLPAQHISNKTRDYSINNTEPWNIAIDPTTLTYSTVGEEPNYVLPNPIFDVGAPPGRISGKACCIAWSVEFGVPGDPPEAGQRTCLGEFFEVEMIPFGAARLHMAELPTVKST
ncbi:hypothetical protein HYALB_00011056 [Hymenoscyphus albidus]|uniref:Uncharacterized protein n=1 Tax=Hymenoscyphus albidus TaxID=595503 RepID=A0A9N9LUD9_9HELO|nr:hypothetical protein HYALB_00011056 [Hymenoscyphus albidus]